MAGDLQGAGGGGDKSSSAGGAAAAAGALRSMEQGAVKCPRCSSPNTKFCYYNNYSLSQPRHFCKSCRRYWTKGGALRNVPMGGGSRKNKKQPKAGASGSTSSSRFLPVDPAVSGFSEPSACCGLNFLGGQPASSPAAAAVDFHLGLQVATSRLLHAPSASAGAFDGYHEFINLLDGPQASPAGFSYPISAYGEGNGVGVVSSIESLSSINQDLHWRLQQQRLGELWVAEEHKGPREDRTSCEREGSRNSRSLTAGWTSTFLDNSCSFPTSTSMTASIAKRSSSNINLSNWSGSIPAAAWNDTAQFSAIP